MGRTTSLIILVFALVMGGLAAYLAIDWLQSQTPPPAASEDHGTIVVASSNLAFGAVITRENVRAIPWPAKQRPEGSFSTVQDLVVDGPRIALGAFVRDEPIVSSKIGAPNERASLSTVIEQGKRAVSVEVDVVRGVAGFVLPGDYVDVALTRTNDGGEDHSEVILQHVKVLAIDQTVGERQDHPTVAKAVTLEVTQEQALKILLASNIGKLSLILRQSAEATLTPQVKVTGHDLFTDAAPAPAAPEAPAPAPQAVTRKVTIVRSTTSSDYDVPPDRR